ncbi:MAG: hypothetical protein ACYC0H_23110, partial [Solirubrobacteraceae bacterium]
MAANSCNADPPGQPDVAVIGGGVPNSFAVTFDARSTALITDTFTGSFANVVPSGSIAYSVDGAGNVTLNLLTVQFPGFGLDLAPVTNLTVVNQGPATGSISGTSASFPPGSLLVSVSGDAPLFGHQVAEPSNDNAVMATLDPVSNSAELMGTFNASSFSATGHFRVNLNLVGSYSAFPPISIAGGPYQGDCTAPRQGTVHVDGSGSTDGNGSKSSLVAYQWYEGSTLVGQGAITDLTLGFGAHELTLRVFNSSGEFADSTAAASIVVTTP